MMTHSIIYQAPNGAIELRWDIEKETVWANLNEIAYIFWRDKSVISRHIKNIFGDEELHEKQVVAKNATTARDGKTYQVDYYNLDMIISVWYRVNSKVATKFRQRATQTLKQHIMQWYTINPQRIEKNYESFLSAVEEVKVLAQKSTLSSESVIELIKSFSKTWFSLDAFDKGIEQTERQDQESVRLEAQDLYRDILVLRDDLIAKDQATMLFAQEKESWSLEWILGNMYQTAFGQDVYPSTESKASHLLYFLVKNHPFTDGNKRSGAFAFIWFLQKSWYVFRGKITPEALTAITLLIATSDPKEKDKVIWLVMLLLG